MIELQARGGRPGLWISNQPHHQGLCYISISFTHTCVQLLNAKLTLDILLKPTQLYKIVQINLHNYVYNICGWYVYHHYFYVSYQKTIILCFNKIISTLFLVFSLCLLNNLIVYPISSYWRYCCIANILLLATPCSHWLMINDYALLQDLEGY